MWLLVLPAIALAAGAYATWRSAPSAYQVAQRIDHNLKLADTLSTALFFSRRGPGGDMRRAQRSQAESVAAGVDPRRAIPIRMPRGVVCHSAAGVGRRAAYLRLRYGLDRRLDLRAPLARIVQERLGYSRSAADGARPPTPGRARSQAARGAGFSLDDSQQKGAGELDAAPDAALDTVGVPDVDNKTAARRAENSKLAQSDATGRRTAG